MHTSNSSQTTQSSQVIKTKKPYMWALIFLVIVLLLTIVAGFFNHSLESDIADLQSQIIDTNNKIDSMNESSNLLQVSALYNKNKPILTKLEQQSKIVSYISHLGDISRKYGVALSGFEYNNNLIRSELVSTSKNERSLAYQNVVSFLSKYNTDENRLFDVGYISNLTGHDSIKFELNFTLK